MVAPAVHEEDPVILRNLQQLAEIALGLFGEFRKGRAPMAHLHDGHAAAAVVEHLGPGLFQHLLGQCGGTGGEVEWVSRGFPANSWPQRAMR